MKLHKTLSSTEINKIQKKVIGKIVGIFEQRKTLNELEEKLEKSLALMKMDDFRKNHLFHKYETMFSLIVSSPSINNPTLLKAICLQIASSISKFYDKKEDTENKHINWGSEFYEISLAEIETKLGWPHEKTLRALFDGVNHFLETYQVKIQYHNMKPTKHKGVTFEILIFPDIK